MTGGRPTVWFVSELYYPELTSTGYFVTKTAEQVARKYPVRVISAQPTYSSRGQIAPWSEVRNGVAIERCRATRLNKDVLPLRAVNFVTISGSIFLRGLRRFERGDIVAVVTNPPLLPFLIQVAARLRGARPVLMVQDVYPEVLVATGMTTAGSRLSRVGRRATTAMYRRMERIVVLGRDMASLIGSRGADIARKLTIITNWGDIENIHADDPGGAKYRAAFPGKLIVQYTGNMGRTHSIDLLLDAAKLLADTPDIHFAIAGWGAKRGPTERRVMEEGIGNVTLQKPAPLEDLSAHIAASDIGVIPFVPGMSGISVPSRMYNVMAAGKPLFAIADDDSELALVIREENIGWVVPPTASAEEVAAALRDAASDRGRLKEMGHRARAVTEAKYSEDRVAADFIALFDEMTLGR